MVEEDYLSKSCLYYETFMERVYGSYIQEKPALQASGIRNLIMAEKGIAISLESVAHFKEQLQEIKKHIKEALIGYMTMPYVSRELIDQLKELKTQVVWADSSDELMRVVQNTIELTNTLFKTEQ